MVGWFGIENPRLKRIWPDGRTSTAARRKRVLYSKIQESCGSGKHLYWTRTAEKTEKTQERKNATGEGTEACSARTKIYSQSGSGNSGQHQFVAERRLFPDSIVGSIDHNRCISCHRRIKLYAPVSGIVTADDGTGILFPASDFRAVDFVYYISNGHQWNAKAVPSRGRQRHDCSNAIDSVSADRSGNDFRSRAHAAQLSAYFLARFQLYFADELHREIIHHSPCNSELCSVDEKLWKVYCHLCAEWNRSWRIDPWGSARLSDSGNHPENKTDVGFPPPYVCIRFSRPIQQEISTDCRWNFPVAGSCHHGNPHWRSGNTSRKYSIFLFCFDNASDCRMQCRNSIDCESAIRPCLEAALSARLYIAGLSERRRFLWRKFYFSSSSNALPEAVHYHQRYQELLWFPGGRSIAGCC